METTEHVKSTVPMDAVEVRLHEVSDSMCGLTVAFRDGKRNGMHLPRNGTAAEIARRLRAFADSIDAGSITEEPKASADNRIEALVPGPRPVFVAGNNEF